MADIILRIRQQGIIRPRGYQVTQWAVTVPISEPPLTPPLATSPLSYSDLFLTRKTDVLESLERVTTLQDFEAYPVKHLEFMEIKGFNGDYFNLNVVPNDVLRINDKDYWIQPGQAPYTNNDFIVLNKLNRAQGLGPKCYTNGNIELPNYIFTNDDIGRWVNLSGFSTALNNGLVKIQQVYGVTALVNKIFTANETGSSWNFPYVQIQSLFPGLEPRFFPTSEINLKWELYRSSTLLYSGEGGATSRNQNTALTRTKRFTAIMPTLEAATALMDVTANQVSKLQRDASLNGTNFTTIITRTFGP